MRKIVAERRDLFAICRRAFWFGLVGALMGAGMWGTGYAASSAAEKPEALIRLALSSRSVDPEKLPEWKERVLSFASHGDRDLARAVDLCLSGKESSVTVMQVANRLVEMSKKVPEPTPAEGMAALLAFRFVPVFWPSYGIRTPGMSTSSSYYVPVEQAREWVSGTLGSKRYAPAWLRANNLSHYANEFSIFCISFYQRVGVISSSNSQTTSAWLARRELLRSPTQLALDECKQFLSGETPWGGIFLYSIFKEDCFYALSEKGIPSRRDYILEYLKYGTDLSLDLWKQDVATSLAKELYFCHEESEFVEKLMRFKDRHQPFLFASQYYAKQPLTWLLRDANSPPVKGFLYSVITAFPSQLTRRVLENELFLEWAYNCAANSVAQNCGAAEVNQERPPDVETFLLIRKHIQTALDATDYFVERLEQP